MDVTGLVLSIGEESTERAIESLEQQTTKLKDIVVIEHISPFYKAMNEGISRVNTEYFLQCDADMIPDEDCVQTMLKFMDDDIGVVIGYLSDDLLGKIQAIKLFRTECLKKVRFTDNISPDTECINTLKEQGWKYVFAHRSSERFGHAPDVLATHNPEYTPLYTYNKFHLEGSRIRYRGVSDEFFCCMDKLRSSDHPMASIALIGLCHGLFKKCDKDGLIPYKETEDFKILTDFMNSHNSRHTDFTITQ